MLVWMTILTFDGKKGIICFKHILSNHIATSFSLPTHEGIEYIHDIRLYQNHYTRTRLMCVYAPLVSKSLSQPKLVSVPIAQ